MRDLYATDATYSEVVSSQYDFTGKVLRTKQAQNFNSVTPTVDKYLTYDHQGRLTKTEQEITNDANGKVTVAENIYNETGQLVNKKLHKVGSSYLQDVNYAYNIRGWLKSINDPDNLSGDLFAERLLYESSESGLNSSYALQYNGNISGMVWNSTEKTKQGYGFTYDGLNRLTLGDYKYYSGGWNDHSKYEERSLTYDKNGNIGTLVRSDQYGNTPDNFTYTYSGNQLSSITGGVTSYIYDLNGNTTTDGLRGMAIGYNLLNLPSSISKSSESISYIYSASGEKLAKRDKNNLYRYYAGSMVYDNNKSLSYILFEEGLVNKSSGAFTYEYHLKDHLGNTRVAFQPNGGGTTTTQVAEYYPFGSSYLPQSPAGTNKYLYNGKEKQDDVLGGVALDEYDYGARFYDPRIGRWHVIDPLAEKYISISPYAYCANNSMKYIDIDGRKIVITINNGGKVENYNLTRSGLVDASGRSVSAPLDTHPGQIVDGYMKMLNSGDENYFKQVTTLIDSKNIHEIDATKLAGEGVSEVSLGIQGESINEVESKAIKGEGVNTTTTFDFSEKTLKNGLPKSNYTTVAHEVKHQFDADQGKIGDNYDKNRKRIKDGDKNPAEQRAMENEDTARDQEKFNRRRKY